MFPPRATTKVGPTKQKLTTEITEENIYCLSVDSVISVVSHFVESQGRFANRPCNDRLYQISLNANCITLGGSSKPPMTPKVPGARPDEGALNWTWFQAL